MRQQHSIITLIAALSLLACSCCNAFVPSSSSSRRIRQQTFPSFLSQRGRRRGECVAISLSLTGALAKVDKWRSRNPQATRTPHESVIRRQGLSSIPTAERYSSEDWFHNIASMPGSQVLQRIKGPIIANMIWSFVVGIIFKFFNFAALPGRVHQLLGSSLGLLLVFRTNASYARYWEGRCLWERLHNKARDLARALSIYQDCVGFERVTALARLACAFPLTLMEHLTGCDHKPELLRLVGPSVVEKMECFGNKPLWVCNRMSRTIRQIPEGKNFSSRERLMFLGLVNDLNSITGSCERLVQTPVPLSYARHTSRFLTLYLASLPTVIVADFTGLSLSFVIGFMTWCLFGILEIGLLIEDPFAQVLRSTWTTVIIDSIVRDVLSTVSPSQESPELELEEELIEPVSL